MSIPAVTPMPITQNPRTGPGLEVTPKTCQRYEMSDRRGPGQVNDELPMVSRQATTELALFANENRNAGHNL